MSELTGRLAELTRALRDEGARVGVGELLAAHRALAAVDSASATDSRLALRAALCSSRADLERFDRAFRATFGDGGPPRPPALEELGAVARQALPRAGAPATGAHAEIAEPAEPELVPAAWSELEALRRRDFAELSDAERAVAVELIRRVARRGPARRSRRLRPARRRTGFHDLRRTTRSALRTHGEPLRLAFSEPSRRPRPTVLVLDVSGSMAPYARMLMVYLQACVAARRQVEAFAFGTRLTRVTHELQGREPGPALQRAAAAVIDREGGTRIGAALAELNRTHGRRLGRGADVIILSDGWDRGDPAELGAELARLRRSAHRLVWLNPLASQPGWEPLTRGMVAAMPHCDTLLAGNSVASLSELAELLEEM